MKLRVVELANRGDADRERIVLKADDEVDIGDFCIMMARRSNTNQALSGDVPHCYWFEDKTIKKGSTVVLYTKEGKSSEKELKSGAVSYFYYWGLKAPKWTNSVIPVLVHTPDWELLEG